LTGTTVAWATNWTWTGGTGVKTFTNIALNSGLNPQLSQIESVQAVWDWSQTSTGTIVADVAFDLFTSATSGGGNAYEIMIWMANYNAGPISANYSSSGAPVPVATSVSIGGYTWNLYSGSNGSNWVFSFLPVSGTVANFAADLNLFLKYLTTNQGLATTQYLTTVQAGTEATSGTATLTTSAYSVSIVSTCTTCTTATTATTATGTGTSTASAATGTQSLYGQCGGQGWTGPTICATGDVCTYSNPYYSQCLA
jgi:xyloglucan-specific endo-beta-1,4-glucanase